MRTVLVLLLMTIGAVATATDSYGQAGPQVAYRVTLWQNADPAQVVTLTGTVADLDSAGVRQHPEATVRIDDEDDPTLGKKWWIEVDPNGLYGVYEVEFPIIRLDQLPAGPLQRLLAPDGPGVVIDDLPARKNRQVGALPRLKQAVWYGVYPSNSQSLQVLIADDGSEDGAGVMIWTPDGEAWIKDFTVRRESGPASPLLVSVSHFPPDTGQLGTAYDADYPVVITPFDSGWYDAIGHYRDWALAQFWAASGPIMERVASGDLPTWYASHAVWTTAIDNNAVWFDLLDDLRVALPGDIAVYWTQWPGSFDKEMPQCFLQFNDAQAFTAFTAQQIDGLQVFPYVNTHLAEDDEDFPPNATLIVEAGSHGPPADAGWYMTDYHEFWGNRPDRVQEFQDDLHAAWSGPVDEQLLARIHTPWFGGYPYEKDRVGQTLRDHWGGDPAIINQTIQRIKRRFEPMCHGAQAWRDVMATIVTRNSQQYGAHGVYLDQFVTNGLYPCFDPSHGHAIGFGPDLVQDKRATLARLRQENPGIVLAAEHVAEPYIDMIQENYTANPQYFKDRPIPLFQSVYHGYTSLYEAALYPPSLDELEDFASVLASVVHDGKKIGSFTTTSTWMELVKPRHAAALGFLEEAADLALQHNETLLYGRRLRSPSVIGSPIQQITWFHNKAGSKTSGSSEPAVRASMWRSLDQSQSRLLLVSNTAAAPVTVTLQSDDLAMGDTLTSPDHPAVTASPTAAITVGPFDWLAFEIAP